MRLLRTTTRSWMMMTKTMPVATLKRFAGSFAIAAILLVTTLVAFGSQPAASARLSARSQPVRSEEARKPNSANTTVLEVVAEDNGLPLPGSDRFYPG